MFPLTLGNAEPSGIPADLPGLCPGSGGNRRFHLCIENNELGETYKGKVGDVTGRKETRFGGLRGLRLPQFSSMDLGPMVASRANRRPLDK